jgi:hypothetical protein
MPVAIFGALLVTLQHELAFTQKWWVVKETLLPPIITFVSFVYGAFLVGTIWIFYFTFGRFWLFLITNIVMDFLFAFPMNNWFQKIGLYQHINYTNWNVFFTFTAISFMIYGYQMWQEGVLIDREKE